MISLEAVKKILGILEEVEMNPSDMAKDVVVTFFPKANFASKRLLNFANELRVALGAIGVTEVPYDNVWENVSFKKRLSRLIKYSLNNLVYSFNWVLKIPQKSFYIPLKSIGLLCAKRRIKPNIVVICIGKQDTADLPMQSISSFKTNSIVTLIELSDDIDINTDFNKHFNESMSLFAYHMTNIVIGLNSRYWLMYNFNASHPIYSYPDPNFELHILKSLIPKLAAPISPLKLSDFNSMKDKFDLLSDDLAHAVNELVHGSKAFSRTSLYPEGKKIDNLPFRESFHKLIGKLHLDNRSGMSFGYFAFQLPIRSAPIPLLLKEFRKKYPDSFLNEDYYIDNDGNIYITIKVENDIIVLTVNDVWVLSLKSGADKTNFNPTKDLIKMGLSNGKLMIQWPDGLEIDNTYKPSFDTKVILAHALANTLVAQVAKYFNTHNSYVEHIENTGFSICHWHGYFNNDHIMPGMITYGYDNSHVSCSSPQSAIYAFHGKFENVIKNIQLVKMYVGDVHVEPHHGINVSYPSLVKLSEYILTNPNCTRLGNIYLK